MDYQRDWEQSRGCVGVPQSPQKAAEDRKAQQQPGQALLLFQFHVFLPKHIKDAPEEARGGKDHTYITFGQMENSTTENLMSKKNKKAQMEALMPEPLQL